MNKIESLILKFILSEIGILILLALICYVPTFYLWTWLVPDIFYTQPITLSEAFGLNLLSAIFFKPVINIKL